MHIQNCLFRLQHYLGCHRANKTVSSRIAGVDQPYDQKKKKKKNSKPEVRGRREPSFIRLTNARVPGPSGRRLSSRHPRQLLRVAAARLHLPVVLNPCPPSSAKQTVGGCRPGALGFHGRLGRRRAAAPEELPAGLTTAASTSRRRAYQRTHE